MTGQKFDALKTSLQKLGSVAVAFSGGVDSTFLLKAAHGALGGRACAVTARSCFSARRELLEAEAFCAAEGIPHYLAGVDLLKVEGVAENPPDRCYPCKRAILSALAALANANGYPRLADGSNADDDSDYRPGARAVRELGVFSPLRDAGLTKDEIRALSREMGLPTWDKPAFACLASRIPYGEAVTEEKLRRIERAEETLTDMGLGQLRVRCHENLARIETDEAGFAIVVKRREEVQERLRAAGFAYVSLDLLGYRMGRLNETLR